MKNPLASVLPAAAVFAWLTSATLFCLVATPARAQDDEDDLAARHGAYVNYLNKNGLPSAQCLRYSPGDLMIRIGRRHDFSEGTTGGEADAMEVFFQKYRAALQPVLDARHPEAKTMRAPLCELLDTLYFFRLKVQQHRSYVTHERIAAYAEHIMAVLYEDEGSRPTPLAARSHPTRDDVAAFAHIKDTIGADLPIPDETGTYNTFADDVRRQLAAVEKAAPSRSVLNIRMLVLDFIDNYPDRVEWPDIDGEGQSAAAQGISNAHNDHTFENLLLKTPLTVGQIDRRPPKDLMETFWEQNKFGDMTPAYERKVDHLFYKQYLDALRPTINASPKAKEMRQPLRALLATIFDSTNSAGDHPMNSVTGPRNDAYAAYLLMYSFLPDADEEREPGETYDSTNADIVLFARLKAAVAALNTSRKSPDLDRFSAKLAAQLRAMESAAAPADPSAVLDDILNFIDQYPDLL